MNMEKRQKDYCLSSEKDDMELRAEGTTLYIDGRELSELDLFVCRFLDILEDYSPYTIISGYVAILFGRTRSTEDIDLLIPVCSYPSFHSLHDACIDHGFEFLNAEDAEGLYSFLSSGYGIRLCEKDTFIPNIEIKFIKNESDEYSFEKRIQLIINGRTFFISPLEIQIAYKFWLGSQKDIEDAIFIRNVCRDVIDEKLLQDFCKSFGVTYESA
ncbi:MAG: hypothetical protein XE11_1514 [Methanomicrobiales archaeon 53_19]|uniref:hypothetical protein n=1 Tax=Methanocalculus sp. TaxID=2004547 RepID=UPI0007460F5A|nr:hypothetical protein [Methanocalculus sp.]KUK70530.1 MAG: hypothetical protein XD88_0609 [Methanocalculus sp. 52_23]KUL02978.1 MAG: hypothetical protein XE11_1514 [Methanomicrobiales archaeon 53_19]HIJ05703.1 hypothetical protein [Methanocalculus sp.]